MSENSESLLDKEHLVEKMKVAHNKTVFPNMTYPDEEMERLLVEIEEGEEKDV